MKTTSVLFNIFLFINGIGTNETVSVSLYEGDSVTLHTNTTIQKDHLIEWRFGDNATLIARINGAADSLRIYPDVLNGRFRDRLQMNNQTGDLTITNITTQHNGNYTRYIKRGDVTKTMNFSVYTEVMVGDSVIPVSIITMKLKDEKIVWRIRCNNSTVAEIIRNGKIHFDVFDGRFRDRLQMNNQTGDLNITNITNQHTGVYEVEITVGSNVYTIHRSFTVPAKEEGEPAGLSPGAISGICGGVCILLLLLAVAVVLYKHFSRKGNKKPDSADTTSQDVETGV